jgi:uncharacterized protein
MELFYKPYPTLEQRQDIPFEELGVIYYRDCVIDLSEAVRDTIILEVPMRIVCQETCRGLCPQCGVNWNQKECNCLKKHEESRNPFKEFFEKHPQFSQ